jgi:hypothetical protein
MTLNTAVHVVKKDGSRSQTTVREVIASKTGTAYETMQMLDEWESLCRDYTAETSAINSEKRRDQNPTLKMQEHLEEIRDKIVKATKDWALTKYWKEQGVMEFGGRIWGSPSEEECSDAHYAFMRANQTLLDLEAQEIQMIEAAKFWAEAPLLFKPDYVDTAVVGNFQMPLYPWVSDRPITVSLAPEPAEQVEPTEAAQAPFLNYPKGTKMRAFINRAREEIFDCRAVVTASGCFQYMPRSNMASFASTEEWILSLPASARATMTVVLRDPRTAMQKRIMDFAQGLSEEPVPIHEKIGVLYSVFQMDMWLLFDSPPRWTKRSAFNPYMKYGNKRMEMQDADGFWCSVCDHEGKIYFNRQLLDSVGEGTLFRIIWPTRYGSKQAIFRLS